MTTALEVRGLVLAPTGRDADMTCDALAGAGVIASACANMREACAAISEGAAALLVAEEALDDESLRALRVTLDAQEPWSDLPIVLLAGSAVFDSSDRAGRLLAPLRNVMVLERPVRVAVLVTAMQVALRARERQYELRGYLARREQDARDRAAMLASEQTARQEAEAANRLKDEFLATVSHELRTPVNVMLGWSGMLRRDQGDAAYRDRALEIIHRNAQAQARVIDELLDVSRIITGKLRMEAATIDLTPLLRDAIEAVRPAVEGKGLTIESHVPDRVPLIWGDPDRLRQVFWNLMTNAVKFTPEGGTLSINVCRTDRDVEIHFADTGIGIPSDVLPYVFDRFRQADSTTTRAHGGLGLGLAIVRQLVELHGGSVQAASRGVGQGAEFIVRLPVGRRPAALTGDAGSNRAAMAADGLQLDRLDGVRILVVDDEPDGREMLAELLQGLGAVVRTSADAADALAASSAFAPEIVLADIAMPGIDGYELLARVRALLPPDVRPRAIALTAYARTEDKMRALAAGFDAHVAKPVDAHVLVRTIRQLSPTRA